MKNLTRIRTQLSPARRRTIAARAATLVAEERSLEELGLVREAQRTFVRGILSPAKPHARLRAAWRRHSELSAKVTSAKKPRSR